MGPVTVRADYGIAGAMSALKAVSCLIDGEVVVCDDSGRASFEILRSRSTITLLFYTRSICCRWTAGLALRAALASLLRKWPVGIAFSEHLEGDGELVSGMPASLGLRGLCRNGVTASTSLGSR